MIRCTSAHVDLDATRSNYLAIAEYLIGKGYDVKIHDPGIHTSLLTGANKEYIEKHIPHLSSRLVATLDELVEHSEILLLTRNGDELVKRITELGKRPTIVDLRGQDKAVKRMLEARKKSRKALKLEVKAAVPIGRGIIPGKGSRSRNGNGNGHKTKIILKA